MKDFRPISMFLKKVKFKVKFLEKVLKSQLTR